MAFCSFCGNELRQGARFCDGCGRSIERDATTSNREVQFDGKVKKCPNCGEVTGSFTLNCPVCGYEFRDTNPSSAVKEFASKYEQIEKEEIGNTSNKNNEENSLSEVVKRKIDLIKSFPIPNTKEDIYEFLILASSNIDSRAYHVYESTKLSNDQIELSNAWKSKYEQAYYKAKVSFGKDSDFVRFEDIYQRKGDEINQAKKAWDKSQRVSKLFFYCIAIIMLAFLVFLPFRDDRAIEKENKRLESIVEEVHEAMQSGDYVLARSRVVTLIFTKTNTSAGAEAAERWDSVREDLLIEIEKEERIATSSVF